MIAANGKALQNREGAGTRRLHFFEPLLDDRFGLGKRALVGDTLSTEGSRHDYSEGVNAGRQCLLGEARAESGGFQGRGSSCPRLTQPCFPSVVSTPYQ